MCIQNVGNIIYKGNPIDENPPPFLFNKKKKIDYFDFAIPQNWFPNIENINEWLYFHFMYFFNKLIGGCVKK